MYTLALAINCLLILAISYVFFFDRSQLATARDTLAINLAISAIIGLLLLTGISAYCMFAKQMTGVSVAFLILSWGYLLYCGYRFLDMQKWM